MRPRCAIDQNAFRFPGARPNMADAWIRNSDWEDDNDLKKRPSKVCQSEFKENGNIRLHEEKITPCTLGALEVLHARMQYFGIQ